MTDDKSKASQGTQDSKTFESSLKQLEGLVAELERGDLPLEQALQKFEVGVRLTRNCESYLKDAEQRVEVLLKDRKAKQQAADATPRS